MPAEDQILLQRKSCKLDLGFTALSRIFHLYRGDRWSQVGDNRSTWEKPPDLPVQNLASQICPKRSYNHSGERVSVFKSQRF